MSEKRTASTEGKIIETVGTPPFEDTLPPDERQAYIDRVGAEEAEREQRLEALRQEQQELEAEAKARAEAEEQAAKERIRQQKRKIAQFKRKWRNKDYSHEEAGKSIIVYGIFYTMQKLAGVKNVQPLFTQDEMASIKALAQDRYERKMYMGYAHLAEWITANFNATSFQQQIFTGSIMELDSLICKVIREESLKRFLTPEDKERLYPWLHQMGLDYMGIQSETEFSEQFRHMSQRITRAKRYIKMYDTAVELLAVAADVKELELYKIRSSYIGNPRNENIETAMRVYNSDLQTLRTMIADREEYQDPYHKDIVSQYLQPVDIEAEEIPWKNIQAVRQMIPSLKIFTTEANMGLIMATLEQDYYWRE